jgi:hypothetical protein
MHFKLQSLRYHTDHWCFSATYKNNKKERFTEFVGAISLNKSVAFVWGLIGFDVLFKNVDFAEELLSVNQAQTGDD